MGSWTGSWAGSLDSFVEGSTDGLAPRSNSTRLVDLYVSVIFFSGSCMITVKNNPVCIETLSACRGREPGFTLTPSLLVPHCLFFTIPRALLSTMYLQEVSLLFITFSKFFSPATSSSIFLSTVSTTFLTISPITDAIA